jgi:hypothetical protein
VRRHSGKETIVKLKMKVGLSGPEISLAPGDIHGFDDADEAQRLIDADFAELSLDEPVTTPVAVAVTANKPPPAIPRTKAPKKAAAPAAGA